MNNYNLGDLLIAKKDIEDAVYEVRFILDETNCPYTENELKNLSVYARLARADGGWSKGDLYLVVDEREDGVIEIEPCEKTVNPFTNKGQVIRSKGENLLDQCFTSQSV